VNPQSNSDHILYLLKTRGARTASWLAKELAMTSMGARGHLLKLEQQGLVVSERVAEQVGRPRQYWQLTQLAQNRFPDRHVELSLALIENVRELFGDSELDRLISEQERTTRGDYQRALANCQALGERVTRLAELRSEAGYMAQAHFDTEQECWVLIENHCPICAAAQSCQTFCRAELELFARALNAEVERSERILLGARRCCYLSRPARQENQLSLL